MKNQAMLIRSTDAEFEPRYREARCYLQNLGFEVIEVIWRRSKTITHLNLEESTKFVFSEEASYGSGLRNWKAHLGFAKFSKGIAKRVKPLLIYCCDFDTFVPHFFSDTSKIVIYDQFDPLSSRFRLPKAMTVVMDFIECRLAQQANFRIVANINRIPNIYKNSFMEIQNIFKLKNVKTEKIKTVKRNILLYGGVLLEDRGLEWVSSTIQELKDWEFHIYGFGPELKNLQELGGANTFIFGGISHDELISRASTATAILALYDPMRKNNMFTASNKLFEACQLGIPLIVNRDTHIGEMVEKYGFGHTISYESRCDLVNALKYLEICTEKERETRKRNMTYFFDKQMAITNNERERLTNGILSHVRK